MLLQCKNIQLYFRFSLEGDILFCAAVLKKAVHHICYTCRIVQIVLWDIRVSKGHLNVHIFTYCTKSRNLSYECVQKKYECHVRLKRKCISYFAKMQNFPELCQFRRNCMTLWLLQKNSFHENRPDMSLIMKNFTKSTKNQIFTKVIQILGENMKSCTNLRRMTCPANMCWKVSHWLYILLIFFAYFLVHFFLF